MHAYCAILTASTATGVSRKLDEDQASPLLACHAGLLLARATLGCAKSRLVGEYDSVASARGESSPLLLNGDIVGAVVRTRRGVKPVFVSPGHRVDVTSAREIVLSPSTRYRVPEPLRRAHAATLELMRRRDARLPAALSRGYPNLIAAAKK
jgi:hypothetical protein